jgi:hypothetical protein
MGERLHSQFVTSLAAPPESAQKLPSFANRAIVHDGQPVHIRKPATR